MESGRGTPVVVSLSGRLGEKAQRGRSVDWLIRQLTLYFVSVSRSCFLPVVMLSFHKMIERKMLYHLDVFANASGLPAGSGNRLMKSGESKLKIVLRKLKVKK